LRNNSLLKHVIEGKKEGKIEVTGRRRRRRQQLLNGLKEKRGDRKLKEEHQITLCGELALEDAMNLSSDRPRVK